MKNHKPKARASPRGGVRRKPAAKLRADGQKRHRRPSPGGDPAQPGEAQGSEEQGKWRGWAVKVHVLIRGDLPDVAVGETHGPREMQSGSGTGRTKARASRRTPTPRDERRRAANPREPAGIAHSAGRGNPTGDRAGVSRGHSTHARGVGKGRTSKHREEP